MCGQARTTSSQFTRLFERSDDPQNLWRVDELRAIWQHQLATALEFDLGGLDEPLAAKLRSLATPRGSPLRTFGELLHHPTPPIELLDIVKQFAKAHSTHPESLLPRDISMALYYSAIAAALVRCGRRISSLDTDTLREGLQRVAKLDWVDDTTRALFSAALGGL